MLKGLNIRVSFEAEDGGPQARGQAFVQRRRLELEEKHRRRLIAEHLDDDGSNEDLQSQIQPTSKDTQSSASATSVSATASGAAASFASARPGWPIVSAAAVGKPARSPPPPKPRVRSPALMQWRRFSADANATTTSHASDGYAVTRSRWVSWANETVRVAEPVAKPRALVNEDQVKTKAVKAALAADARNAADVANAADVLAADTLAQAAADAAAAARMSRAQVAAERAWAERTVAGEEIAVTMEAATSRADARMHHRLLAGAPRFEERAILQSRPRRLQTATNAGSTQLCECSEANLPICPSFFSPGALLPSELSNVIASYAFEQVSSLTIPASEFAFDGCSTSPPSVSGSADFQIGSTSSAASFSITAYSNADVAEGVVAVFEASVQFGESLLGLTALGGLETKFIALRHFPSVSPSESAPGFTGGTTGGDTRLYLTATLAEFSLKTVAEDILGIESLDFPFELPLLSNVALTLAYSSPSFDSADDDYDGSSISPSLLPESVRVASKDGVWLSATYVVQNTLPRVLLCSIAKLEISDGECDATSIDLLVYMALPNAGSDGGYSGLGERGDGLDLSWLRFSFPEFDPTLPSLKPWVPGLPDLSVPKLALGLDGIPRVCGTCGFPAIPDFVVPSNPDALAPSPPTAPQTAGGSLLPSGLLDKLSEFAFPGVELPTLQPFSISGFVPFPLEIRECHTTPT